MTLWFAPSTAVRAQQADTVQTQNPPPQRWVVETKDGSVFQGTYLGQSEAGIRLLTESAGEVLIRMDAVKNFRILDERNFRNGVYWFENPNASRYLFTPSAYSLRKGEFYFQNTYLVLNSFNYGVTDRFTIGAGFELVSTFSGEPIFFITPKYTFPISKNWNAGVGVLYLNVALDNFAGVEDLSGGGIGYGIITYGNRDNNATLGVGYGYFGGAASGKPVVNLSGMKRVGRKVALVTENWLVPADGYYGVYSYGLRFMGEKITVDFAFLNNPDIASEIIFIGVPYIDFVVKFGK